MANETPQFIALRWAEDKIRQAVGENMYGALTFQFQDGKIIGVEIKKTEKPPVDVKVGR